LEQQPLHEPAHVRGQHRRRARRRTRRLTVHKCVEYACALHLLVRADVRLRIEARLQRRRRRVIIGRVVLEQSGRAADLGAHAKQTVHQNRADHLLVPPTLTLGTVVRERASDAVGGLRCTPHAILAGKLGHGR